MKTDFKRVRTPKGKKRVKIVDLDVGHPITQDEYDKMVENDFESCRANYVTVFVYDTPVLIKVEDGDE